MKLKAILSVFVAFSLALSSCDKKNAFLVNRRTATPEKIKITEETSKAKEEENLLKKSVVPSPTIAKDEPQKVSVVVTEFEYEIGPDQHRDPVAETLTTHGVGVGSSLDNPAVPPPALPAVDKQTSDQKIQWKKIFISS
ncbi:hypothetical protein AGMMS49531_11070 [Endomicrobiia bacterium]|nr:hypothetical protein AGMMS49531_11070 [Endomicrobiia bacterium]